MTKKRLLIFEDDVDTVSRLQTHLSEQGYDVLVTAQGKDALTLTYEQSPDLIVLDIMLSDISAHDVCRTLRQASHTRHTPIIFLLHEFNRYEIIKVLELGADNFLVMPLDLEESEMRIRSAIERAERDANTDIPTSALD